MRKFGLIGFPLGHSFSKSYFTDFFYSNNLSDCYYENYELENISNIREIIGNDDEVCGLNVTIPHKKEIIKYLDEISDEAKNIGAVNCVVVDRCNSNNLMLKGYNTDVYGFKKSLLQLIGDNRPHALVLGTGGASLAVQYVLQELNISYLTVSRGDKSGCIKYSDITPSMLNGALIVNTTPLGMYPNVDSSPEIDYSLINENNFLYDLVYNPSPTLFLRKGLERGAKIRCGTDMLRYQAEKAWKHFTK